NVSRWRKAQPAREFRAQVADNVSEEIARHDDIELTRVAHDLHRQRINVQVARINIRILLADLLKHPLPEVVGESHGVGFVAHAHAFQGVLTRVFERVTDDALYALA